MEKCKVEFISDKNQKIVIDFELDDNNNLEYKPHFEPKITDPKADLGLIGKLCEIFITSLIKQNEPTNS